jgi:anti-anti-sigma factor
MPGDFLSRLQRKSIRTYFRNGYQVFDVRKDLGLRADLGDLSSLIKRSLEEGKINIALRFTQRSYLYSHTLANLVNFYKMAAERGGTLCLLEPNESILQVLEVLGLTKCIETVSSEQEMGIAPSA